MKIGEISILKEYLDQKISSFEVWEKLESIFEFSFMSFCVYKIF